MYRIFTDAAGDIDPVVVEKENIGMIPMRYMLDEKELITTGVDTIEEVHNYYEAQRSGKLTKTTQAAPQFYVDYFMPILEAGEDVLYIALSGGLSGTFASSVTAAEELRDMYPNRKVVCVDSYGATGSMGMLVECAAKNRAEGMSINDNAKWISDNCLKIQHWFMVDDLGYLRRGGRISAASAVMGSALSVKPVLTILKNGTLANIDKKRGFTAGANQLVEYYKNTTVGGDGERVYVIHADNMKAADYLTEKILEINPKADVVKHTLTPFIGAHTGPGMCAIIHFSNEERQK